MNFSRPFQKALCSVYYTTTTVYKSSEVWVLICDSLLKLLHDGFFLTFGSSPTSVTSLLIGNPFNKTSLRRRCYLQHVQIVMCRNLPTLCYRYESATNNGESIHFLVTVRYLFQPVYFCHKMTITVWSQALQLDLDHCSYFLNWPRRTTYLAYHPEGI